MEFTLSALTILCLVFFIALWHVWKKLNLIDRNIDGLYEEIRAVRNTIANLPPTIQNIIPLGLKDAKVGVDLESPINLPFQPEDFQIRADKLRDKLLHGLATKTHPDTDTQAWCILEHAGFGAYVESESRRSVQSALTRLLLNGDEEAVKIFLSTVADSVGQIHKTTAEATL